jgi:hypothetical protein
MFDINSTTPYWSVTQQTVTLDSTPVVVCPYSPQRAILYFASSTGTTAALSQSLAGFVLSNAQLWVPSQQILKLTWSDDGPMCQAQYYAWVQSGVGHVVITQVLWRPTQS